MCVCGGGFGDTNLHNDMGMIECCNVKVIYKTLSVSRNSKSLLIIQNEFFLRK